MNQVPQPDATRGELPRPAWMSKKHREYLQRLMVRKGLLGIRLADTKLRDKQEIEKELHALEWAIEKLSSTPETEPRSESDDEWYEREKTAFRAWWEAEGEKTFSETPTMAAGAGWLKRAEEIRYAPSEIEPLAEVKKILQDACDRDWEDETLLQTAHIASNAIYWRDREIANLKRDRDARAREACTAEGRTGCSFAASAIAAPDTVISKIIEDIKDRRGLGDEWDQIDVDIRNEIAATWRRFFNEPA